MAHRSCFIGTAGWAITANEAERLPGPGSHLQRYGRGLNAVEINSSFYRPHRYETYERWAGTVPADFRFSVKLPKTIPHERRLVACADLLDEFFAQASGLGGKLGVILVQLPPSLRFEAEIVENFLADLRTRTAVGIAAEPRHASWFEDDAEAILEQHCVARVAADPTRFAGGDAPAGWPGLAYFRLHGSPRVYYSDYEPQTLDAIAQRMDEAALAAREVWCIFDNTTQGHALGNALDLAAATSARSR